LKARVSKKTKELFAKHEVLNEVEIDARYEIDLEEYALRLQIEGRVLGDIATNHIIPTAIKYQNVLIKNVKGLQDIFGKDFKNYAEDQMELIKVISGHVHGIKSKVHAMIEERKKANNLEHADKKAKAYCDKVKPYFEEIRLHCDKLEMMIDDEIWPMTKYRELLFTK
jgi:glutamine synthetase